MYKVKISWYIRATFIMWKCMSHSEISSCKSEFHIVKFHHIKVHFIMWKCMSHSESSFHYVKNLQIWFSSESSHWAESEPNLFRARARLTEPWFSSEIWVWALSTKCLSPFGCGRSEDHFGCRSESPVRWSVKSGPEWLHHCCPWARFCSVLSTFEEI